MIRTGRHDFVISKTIRLTGSQKICQVITSFLSVCFENDNFRDVRPDGNMSGFNEDRVCLFPLFTVLHFKGKSFF